MNTLSDEELIKLLEQRLTRRKKVPQEEYAMLKQIHDLSNKLKRAESLKSSFLSNIRNEINNPLSAIVGLSKFLKEDEYNDLDKSKRSAALIYHEAFNLEFQMRNIFAAADIEAGAIRPEPALIDAMEIIKDVINAYRFKADQKDININVQANETQIKINSDAYMLYMILVNLVANAVEYSPFNEEVNVSMEIDNENLIVAVRDRGVGIDPDNQRKIFERFTQLDQGSTKQHNGQGLGLSVAKEFAEALGGVLTVKSAVNHGSLFKVSLPPLQAATQVISEDWNEVLFNNDEVM